MVRATISFARIRAIISYPRKFSKKRLFCLTMGNISPQNQKPRFADTKKPGKEAPPLVPLCRLSHCSQIDAKVSH